MSKITRATQAIFGSSGLVGSGGFGAAAASNTATETATSASLATIQGLSAWSQGWIAAVLGATKYPAVEDLNALNYLLTTQLSYLFQQGIPEYDAGTTYYADSIVCKTGTYQLYGSITNGNIGNALTDGTNWQLICNLGGFGNSLASSGYQRISGGLIIQWGLANFSGTGSVTFPLTFPNAAYAVTAVDGGTGEVPKGITSLSTTGFTINATSGTLTYWIALGS